MEKWNFSVQGNPQKVIKQLDTALGSTDSFIFDTNKKKDSIGFRFYKRIKYPDQILHRNRIVVDGKAVGAKIENETEVEISFKQHTLMTVTVWSVIIACFALLVFIPSLSSGISTYILIAAIVAVGAMLWIALQRKFEKDTQQYKRLISQIMSA